MLEVATAIGILWAGLFRTAPAAHPWHPSGMPLHLPSPHGARTEGDHGHYHGHGHGRDHDYDHYKHYNYHDHDYDCWARGGPWGCSQVLRSRTRRPRT